MGATGKRRENPWAQARRVVGKTLILFAQQLSSDNGRGQYETAIARTQLTEYVGTLETNQRFGGS